VVLRRQKDNEVRTNFSPHKSPPKQKVPAKQPIIKKIPNEEHLPGTRQ
jgi:hypothetical protein